MKECNMTMHGSVTVGAKGQVVIPKEVRSTLDIEEGDKLLVITKENVAIGLIKSENMQEILDYLQQELKNS